ncbi:hypothetical protein EJ06DRAFT_492726 [Trichodelitschia bisporula]|uniref:Intermediate filament protein-like protein n=1 Tax=Trichodelitschia bisporula TaxID=703511 RepID=A0A6G1I054_9PEZI|nr:hypothetical protein EJ06DRAFT_492726 [Trichodelitschia bisporula]
MELTRRDVLLAALTAFIAWGYATHYLPSLRFLPYAFIAGCLAVVLGFLYTLLTTARAPPEPVKDYGPRGAAFVRPALWKAETEALAARAAYVPAPLCADAPAVGAALDRLLKGIEGEFVGSWFGAISSRPVFVNEVDRAIRVVAADVIGRVSGLDIVGVAVARVVPMLTAHLGNFYEAERAVKGRSLSRNFTEGEELDLVVAGRFRAGKLHAAVPLAFADTRSVEQQYIRGIVVRLLQRLMPGEMSTSPAVSVLVKEIVSCAVLFPLIQTLSDPDTWNQLIVTYGKSLLQERKTVRKLRAALDEHAPSSPRSIRPAPFPKLTPQDNERKFERFIRSIRACNNLSDARRFRSEVAAQLRKESAVEGQDPLFLRRLEAAKRILDQRISQLGAGGAPAKRAPPSGPRRASKLENATLREVLYTASGLSCFMDYMDRQHLMRLVQFWIVVDGFRNPLEDDADESESADFPTTPMWTEQDRADIAQINEAYLSQPEIKISPLAREAVRTFLRAGSRATNAQYQAARKSVLRAQTAAYEEMRDPHFETFKHTTQWFKLLASEESAPSPDLPASDPEPPPRMHKPALPPRAATDLLKKPTDLRRSALSSSDLKAFVKSDEPPRRSLDNGRAPLFDDDVDEPLARSTASLDSDGDGGVPVPAPQGNDPHVVDAMQAALTDIMHQAPDRDALFSPIEPDSMRSSLELPPRIGSPAQGATGSSRSREKPSIASLGLVGAPGRSVVFKDDLFGEEEKFLEDEREDSDAEPGGASEDDIHEAAPGDLGLAEAIDALTLDIEKLVTQERIVDSLTRKAELTNNAAELRILRKSKASLQREINRKELQRQQYIVQESDNSLYGRATISIPAITVGKEEDGKEFALYVIEVHRTASSHIPAATWAVARRYSEFHALHKRLRTLFPLVRNLDFPRRQIGLGLQKDVMAKRRTALEGYLRELLKEPALCRSRDVRAFLSQQAVPSAAGAGVGARVEERDFVTRIYNSVTDGMEDFLGNIPVLDQLSLAGQNLISVATTQLAAGPQGSGAAGAPLDTKVLTAEAEAEAELRALDAARELEPFVKPICDLFLEAFELNRSNNWLRGRAVVMVLQKLLGGTVERKVREGARSVLCEEGIAKLLDMIAGLVAGEKKDGVKVEKTPRTAAEKARTKQEAAVVLVALVPELVGSVVGRGNGQAAARRVVALVNNRRLNSHLVFSLLDEVVQIVFGEPR